MNNSLVGKYFDFGQALEFLKEGYAITNNTYNDNFRIEYLNKNIKVMPLDITEGLKKEVPIVKEGYYLHNIKYVDNNNTFYNNNGEEAILFPISGFDLDDILNEKWYIYEE